MSLRSLILVFSLVITAIPAQAGNLISAIQVKKDPAQSQGVLARVHCQQAPVFQVYDALSPHRVVLEFLATDLTAGLVESIKAQSPMTKLRVERSQSSAGQLTRLVFEVADGSTYDVRSHKNDIILRLFLDRDSDDAWQAQERAEKQRQQAEAAQLKAEKAKAEQRAREAAKKAQRAEEQKQLANKRAQEKLAKAKAQQERIAAEKRQAEEERARSEARARAAEKARQQAEQRRQEAEALRLAQEKEAAQLAQQQQQERAEHERQVREQEKKRLQEQQRLREQAEQKAHALAKAKKQAEEEIKKAKTERQILLQEKQAAAVQAAKAKKEQQKLREALHQAEQEKQRLAQQAAVLTQQNRQAHQIQQAQSKHAADQAQMANSQARNSADARAKQRELLLKNEIQRKTQQAQQAQALQEQRRQLEQQQREIAKQRAQLKAEQQALKVASLESSQRQSSHAKTRAVEPGFGGAGHTSRRSQNLRSTSHQQNTLPSHFVRISAPTPGQGSDLANDDDGRMVSPKEVANLKLVHRGADDILKISIPGGANYSLNRRNNHSTVLTLWDSVIYQLGFLRALDARAHGGVVRYISPEVEGRLRSHVNIVIEHRPGARIFVQGNGDKLNVIFR